MGNPYHIYHYLVVKYRYCVLIYLIEHDGNVHSLEIFRQFTKVEPNGIMHKIQFSECKNQKSLIHG